MTQTRSHPDLESGKRLLPWSVAIFSSREHPDILAESIRAAARGSAGSGAAIDVLVNGNRSLAEDVAKRFGLAHCANDDSVLLRVWSLPLADKSHAWNEYVHRLWPEAATSIFVDGYTRPRPDAFAILAQTLATEDDALGATGVPTAGRSAAAMRQLMLSEGGIHGNLYALRRAAMLHFRTVGFRLPLGLYRTDALVGAVLCFGLDPRVNQWDVRRIRVLDGVRWDLTPLSASRWRDLKVHFKRVLRQAQGTLENAAIRDFLAYRHLQPESMPTTASELVMSWLDRDAVRAWTHYLANPLSVYSMRQLRKGKDWSAASEPPQLIATGYLRSPPAQ